MNYASYINKKQIITYYDALNTLIKAATIAPEEEEKIIDSARSFARNIADASFVQYQREFDRLFEKFLIDAHKELQFEELHPQTKALLKAVVADVGYQKAYVYLSGL